MSEWAIYTCGPTVKVAPKEQPEGTKVVVVNTAILHYGGTAYAWCCLENPSRLFAKTNQHLIEHRNAPLIAWCLEGHSRRWRNAGFAAVPSDGFGACSVDLHNSPTLTAIWLAAGHGAHRITIFGMDLVGERDFEDGYAINVRETQGAGTVQCAETRWMQEKVGFHSLLKHFENHDGPEVVRVLPEGVPA